MNNQIEMDQSILVSNLKKARFNLKSDVGVDNKLVLCGGMHVKGYNYVDVQNL